MIALFLPIILAVVFSVACGFMKFIDFHSKKLVLIGLWLWVVLSAATSFVPDLVGDVIPLEYTRAAVLRFWEALFPLWYIIVAQGILSAIITFFANKFSTFPTFREVEKPAFKITFKGTIGKLCTVFTALGTVFATLLAVLPRVNWVMTNISTFDITNFDARHIYNIVGVLPECIVIVVTVYSLLSIVSAIINVILTQKLLITSHRAVGQINLFKKVDLSFEHIDTVTTCGENGLVWIAGEQQYRFASVENRDRVLESLKAYVNVADNDMLTNAHQAVSQEK